MNRYCMNVGCKGYEPQQLGPGLYTWHCGCFYVIDSLSLPVVLMLFCCLQLYPLVTHCGGAQTRNDSDLK